MKVISIVLIIMNAFLFALLFLSNLNQPFLFHKYLINTKSKSKHKTNVFRRTQKSTNNILKINRSKVFLVYRSGSSYIDPIDPKGERCLIPWTYTKNMKDAQLIMYNALDNYGAISSPRSPNLRPDQATCVESMESATNYRAINKNRHSFNYTMTYSLTSDVPIPYSEFFESSEMPLNISEKKDYFVCAFISNCGAANKRTAYVKELMGYIKIDSYGSCLRNAKIPSSFKRENRYRTKEAMLSHYKFTIAFENSDDEDYITEKLYQPLRYGSVPIFRGCPNMEDFIPPHSAIDANKFNSAKELADYLNYLDKNDTAYNEYLQWKYDHNYGNMAKIRFFRDRYEYGVCALVERMHGLWINPYLTDWERVTKAETMCNKCLDDFDMSKKRNLTLREDGWTYDYPLGEYWSNVLNISDSRNKTTQESQVVKNIEEKNINNNNEGIGNLLMKEIAMLNNERKYYPLIEKVFSLIDPFI